MAGIFLPGSSKPGGGDITSVVAGVGLSGGATADDATLTLDLSELSAVVPTSGDWFATLDSDEANEQLTTTDALATLFAGDGLTASSAVLAVNVDDSTIETNSDAIRIKDNGVSLAKMAGLTRGSIIYGDTNGDPAALAKGNANEVLTSDGTDIAWAAAASGVSLSGSTDNTVATVTGSNALAGEANLTFDGSTLAVTGAVTVSTDLTVSGGDIVYGNGQNATASVTATAHDAAGRNLTITAGPTTAGTSNNQAGGALTLQGGQGKGSGAGGDIIFQTANAGGSGSSLNSLATALTLSDDLSATFAGAVDLGSNTLTSTGSLQVRTIDYSDGDNAITIADGGGVTFPVSIDITGSTGIILENDETITNSTNGTISFSGGIAVPDAGNIGSASDLDAIAIAANGNVTYTQNIYIKDDKKIIFGDGSDASLEYDEDGTDQLRIAGNTIFENQVELTKDLLLDPTPSNPSYSGITATFTAGETLEAGEVVYLKAADTKMWKAVSVVSGTGLITPDIMCVAMAAEDISADAAGLFLLQGFLRDDDNFPTYAIGETLYVPEAEQGGQNVPHGTIPTTDGDFVQVIGWAADANTVYFNPDFTIIEHA